MFFLMQTFGFIKKKKAKTKTKTRKKTLMETKLACFGIYTQIYNKQDF